MTNLSFEEQRRKAKLSEEDFAAIQQPFDIKTGKKNPNFDKIYQEKQRIKEKLANKQAQEEIAEVMEKQERKEFEERDGHLHPKYL